MSLEHLDCYLDLQAEIDPDPEMFVAALAVKHLSNLIAGGGSSYRRPDLESTLQPVQLEAFLARAVEMAKRTKRFEHEWRRLQQVLPRLKAAWEKGQEIFQEDLARAAASQEESEYLSEISFSVDGYAYISAKNTYPNGPALQAWAINGYMVAWWRYFLVDD